jgi:hypothetical protein
MRSHILGAMVGVLLIALVPLVILVPVLASDVWVFKDAQARAERGRPIVLYLGRFAIDTPFDWFLCCLVLWVVFFPLYITSRGAPGPFGSRF